MVFVGVPMFSWPCSNPARKCFPDIARPFRRSTLVIAECHKAIALRIAYLQIDYDFGPFDAPERWFRNTFVDVARSIVSLSMRSEVAITDS
jgi:hypothetical protein